MKRKDIIELLEDSMLFSKRRMKLFEAKSNVIGKEVNRSMVSYHKGRIEALDKAIELLKEE